MLYTLKQSTNYPSLHVKKYTKKVYFKDMWDDELIESRGHVYHNNGNLVINPFTKVFHRFQHDTDIPLTEFCTYVEKINGFMGCITYVEEDINDFVISTTGSLDSEYVDFVDDFVTDKVLDNIEKGYTYIFEVCHPADPHIISEKQGLYLLGRRKVSDKEHYTTDCINEADLDAIAFNMGVYRPHWGFDTFENILNNCKKVMFEGYMVYSPSTTIKLKSPYYSSLKAIARSPDLNKFNRGRLSPEFIKIFDELDLNKFQDLDEQERLKILKQDYNEKILHIR